jgi:hypothetical protein
MYFQYFTNQHTDLIVLALDDLIQNDSLIIILHDIHEIFLMLFRYLVENDSNLFCIFILELIRIFYMSNLNTQICIRTV